MIISDISIQNFRTFKEKCNLNDIKRLNVFVGPNMAGKSNVFEALKLLKSLAYHEEQSKFIENIFDKMQRSKVEICLTMSLSDIERREIIKPLLKRYPNLFSGTDIKKNNFFRHVRYCVSISKNVISGVKVNGEVTEEQLHISAPKMDYVLVLYHKVSSDGHPTRYFCDIENQFSELVSISDFKGLKLKQKENWNIGRGILNTGKRTLEADIAAKIKDFFTQIKIYYSYRHGVTSIPREEKELCEDGNNIVNLINTLRRKDLSTFNRIVRALKSIYDLKNITPIADSNAATINIKERELKSEIDFRNMSYGLQQTLILVTAIETAKPNQTICIEEPELHLHTFSQNRIVYLMQKKSCNNQFFITTHSSNFAKTDDHTSTYLITRTKGSSKITQIENKSDLKLIKHQLGIRNSDIYGDDLLLCVEGDSEEIAFPIILPVMGYNIIEKALRIYNLKGKDNVKNLELLLKYIKNMGVRVFVILDNDNPLKNKLQDFARIQLIEKYDMWDRDFEDAFESQTIISAMQKLAKNKNFKFQIDKEKLELERKSLKIFDILKKYMESENSAVNFKKTDLATQIAYQFTEEIRGDSARYQSENIEFGKKINKIMRFINLERNNA